VKCVSRLGPTLYEVLLFQNIHGALWANTRLYCPPNVTSNDMNISHQHAVNSRYLLYTYCHLTILSSISHTLTPVSHPHLTLRRHIPTDVIASSKSNGRMSICMDCFHKYGVTLAQTHLTALIVKCGSSWIQT
jgi:hypothetical protein